MEQLAKEAFPPEEYLAPSKLIEMSANREVDFWAIYDDDTFVGYAVIRLYEDICYLFFLAICPHLRSQGYGRKTLQLFDRLYPDKQQVVDFEMVDDSAPNNTQRMARKAFYMRNGYKETGKLISYLGVDYEIVCKSDDFHFDQFRQMMKTFHIDGFSPVYFEKPNKR